MKRTTSFNLEKDTLDEIELYKEKYNLSSRNVALERMLLERRNFFMFLDRVSINNEDRHINEDMNKEANKKDSIIGKSVGNSMANMPD